SRSAIFLCDYTSTPDISTLSLHDALPISCFVESMLESSEGLMEHGWIRVEVQDAAHFLFRLAAGACVGHGQGGGNAVRRKEEVADRKSTRLNSSHGSISYAVFCLKKKKRS